jgi:tripartite-type tricarboxylate transporter receptor subunit TctC
MRRLRPHVSNVPTGDIAPPFTGTAIGIALYGQGTIVMKFSRRDLLRLGAAAVALPAASRVARAQSYPNRPVHIIVGFPAGSTGDTVTRLMGQWLSERLGQPFIIENRPGAGSNIATEAVVRARPDGHTLLCVTTANEIGATLYKKLNFNFIRDIAPVAGFIQLPLVAEINPSVPAKTIPELIAYSKANPGKINMASAGNGTIQHVAGELFNMMAGVKMLHVPYRGSPPALTDLMGGQVQVMFDLSIASIEYIRAGNLRALAVTSAARSPALPDIPTMGEFVPGYEASAWNGLGAPKDTPPEIVDKLNREINAGLADPKIKEWLANMGAVPMVMTPAEFGKLVADETDKWAKVVSFAGITAD